MIPTFHPLRVREVRRETANAISVSFEVPPELRDAYRFTQGQYLTLRTQVGGEELRRSYSICCGEDDYAERGELRVAIRKVPGGRFSGHANEALRAGATLEVMTPEGRFHPRAAPGIARHHVAFAAGSGITPILSLMRTTLAREPGSRFTLVYGNRSVDTVLFLEALEALKNRYLERVRLYHVLSRQPQDIELFNGRIDAAKVRAFMQALIPATTIDEAYVCGPSSMIDEVEGALLEAGIPRPRVHCERFGVPDSASAPGVAGVAGKGTSAIAGRIDRTAEHDPGQAARLTVILDGKSRELAFPYQGAPLLDTALAAGLPLPYACKGGVCCTCRAKLLEGEVRMDKNFTLEDWELAQGFVLTCQSHPVSERVVVSYDER